MLRGRASHHMKVPDHCVSVCDISLTETGKGSGPTHNLTIKSSVQHVIYILAAFYFPLSYRIPISQSQSWMFTLNSTSNSSSQYLQLSKDFTHSCISIFLAESILECMLLLPYHTSLARAGAPKGIQDMLQ